MDLLHILLLESRASTQPGCVKQHHANQYAVIIQSLSAPLRKLACLKLAWGWKVCITERIEESWDGSGLSACLSLWTFCARSRDLCCFTARSESEKDNNTEIQILFAVSVQRTLGLGKILNTSYLKYELKTILHFLGWIRRICFCFCFFHYGLTKRFDTAWINKACFYCA